MSSPSLRPLIDTCQKCSTSPANHEPRSPANGSFQNPGVCPQAVPSFPSPTPTVLFLALAPFSAQAKYRKPRSSVFLCSQTLRKRLLRRLTHSLCAIRSTKISGHFCLKLNGPARSNRKRFEKASPPYEVDPFSWFARSERNWPLHLTFLTHSESQYLVVR